MSNVQVNYQKHLGFMHNPAVKAEIAALDAVNDCQRIVQLLVQYEFAWDITRSLEIALFYTYGSATVSGLLDRTGEFAKHGQKRYDDTRLLIAHFMDGGWDGPIGSAALARMNKTHAHYKIANDDFLFVLWTFIDFPIRWSLQFGPRPFTAHEQLAWFNFWIEIGRRMGMVELPTTKTAFDEWVDLYCSKVFVYAPANQRVAEATLAILKGWVPSAMQGMVGPVVYSFFADDSRFLAAIGATAPNPVLVKTILSSLKALNTLRRQVAFGPYPFAVDDAINRSYPSGVYAIDALKPVHLEKVEND
ncbi:MAG: oxygenase MpaB family protein [Moraxellaceae bacterium]|nr:oxygenase MpaB family protein [Moraxellaceae bacterium]MDP1775821.1 oxygenase MpaB family protein [Moraxellaceae bacterium]